MEAVLTGLGRGYTAADVGRIRPFIDLGPYETSVEIARFPVDSTSGDFPVYAPIHLMTARRQTLESLWRYVGAPVSGRMLGDPLGWQVEYTRCGRAGEASTYPYDAGLHDGLRAMIFPDPDPVRDEARQLASLVLRLRQSGALAWETLREEIAGQARAGALFKNDWNDLAAYPMNARSWALIKASLVFQAVCEDPYPHELSMLDGPQNWATWGRPPRPALARFR